jgi:ribose transport system ATP-binding protein
MTGAEPTGESTAVAIRNLSKSFPGTRALAAVDLDVAAGEIHGLCGGNGSGKSTLIKILAGVYDGEEGGEIRVGDVLVPAQDMTPTVAHDLGIRVVHQDLGVFPDLTIAENIALGHGFETGKGGRIHWRAVRARTAELIKRFEIPGRPGTRLGSLSRAAQTQVAIARALQDQDADHSGLLILDEPTTALPIHEVDLLFTALRRYAAAGQSILFVSHRLDEVLSFTNRVTVLRDGVKTGSWPTSELNEDKLIELIVGRGLSPHAVRVRPAGGGDAALEVEGLRAGPLQGVDLRVEAGEIVGVAGLLGSGRSELLRVIFGDLKPEAGTLRIAGEEVRFGHPRDAMAAGVALIPEDRAVDAAFLDLPVYANVAVTVLDRYWSHMRLRERGMRRDGRGALTDFGVKAASESVPLNTLSGGNQQKVILARWLQRSPRLLLLDEPTQGVDVGARADIYALVRKAVDAGAAAVVVVSDLEEMAQVVDRAVVLRHGRVVADVRAVDMTAHRLTELSYADDGVLS